MAGNGSGNRYRGECITSHECSPTPCSVQVLRSKSQNRRLRFSQLRGEIFRARASCWSKKAVFNQKFTWNPIMFAQVKRNRCIDREFESFGNRDRITEKWEHERFIAKVILSQRERSIKLFYSVSWSWFSPSCSGEVWSLNQLECEKISWKISSIKHQFQFLRLRKYMKVPKSYRVVSLVSCAQYGDW